jgi:hypothetical protein
MHRGFFVWFGGIVVVLGSFLILMAAGWPLGGPDQCTQHPTNQCYCEAYDMNAVQGHTPGVRQHVNTWPNLYAIGTSFLIACFVYYDRVKLAQGGPANSMRSMSLLPDLYIFADQFLGLGSMWFHASLRTPWSAFDALSMFVYAGFLVAYTMHRIWPSPAAMLSIWLGYGMVVFLFTILTAVNLMGSATSPVLIGVLVAAYLVLELWPLRAQCVYDWRWWAGVGCITLATIFWFLSQTGAPMCHPSSPFQPHGLLWHPLAGAMALFLYFYWRDAPDPAPASA